MKKLLIPLFFVLALTACGAPAATPVATPEAEPAPTAYQLKAGETLEVADIVFPEEVTITVDPASTAESRSEINFLACTFEKGLKIIGDNSAFIRILDDCSLGEGYGVTAEEATAGSAKAATIDDDFIKLYLAIDGVDVTTSTILNTMCTAESFTLNGNQYLLADYPDCNIHMAAFYYENGAETYVVDAWTE